MATFLDPNNDLLTIPFSAATDFTDLADCCDRFAETLIECSDLLQKMALLGRIGTCLALLCHAPRPSGWGAWQSRENQALTPHTGSPPGRHKHAGYNYTDILTTNTLLRLCCLNTPVILKPRCRTCLAGRAIVCPHREIRRR